MPQWNRHGNRTTFQSGLRFTTSSLRFSCKRAHSYKKQKDSLEIRAELAFLRIYVEKKAILEPILFYWTSKFKQTKDQGSKDCLWSHFLPFYKIIVSFFSFLCQDANKARSKCAIIGCNSSKKHKLALHKTQNGEPNYVNHTFFFNYYQELPTCTKPWGRTSKCSRAG